ncbi:DUF3329 domain-containing protein [Selenomonas noxia]
MRSPVLRTALTAAAVFAFMLALNHWMPLHRDDYDYLMVWKTGVPIASLSDVFSSAWDHYLLHGGRMMTILCLDLFLWLGKSAFDIANALMFLALVLLAVIHAQRSYVFWQAPELLAASAFLLWFCLPHFGEVAVWKSGSTVYLWSAVPAFLFLLPYNLGLRAMDEGKQVRRTWPILPMLLLGICAGWSIENLAVTIVMTALGACLYARRRYGALPAWMVSGALGALIGLIGLVGAPGNYVRYAAQGSDKGILTHIGNQFAEQGEMMLYLLPVLLIMRTAYRLYQKILAGLPSERYGSGVILHIKKHVIGVSIPSTYGIGVGTIVLTAALVLLTVSYFTGGWFGGALHGALIAGVMTPLGIAKPKAIHLFTNVMNGFEEMTIYSFALLLFYARLQAQLGLISAAVRAASEHISLRTVLHSYPAVRYAAFLTSLAVCNNLVMLATPAFPAPAAFSSAAMFVTAALALLSDTPIRNALLPRAGSVLCTAGFVLFAFTGTSALLITQEMAREDVVRTAAIREAVSRGETTIDFPRIELTNRALRHVYYEDWDNGMTRDGAMEYFGLYEITVEGN